MRSSRVVLPAPGELITFSAVIPCSVSQDRFRAASSSFFASTAISRSSVWVRVVGPWSCGWSWSWVWSWVCPSTEVTRTSSLPHPHVVHMSEGLHGGDGELPARQQLDVRAATVAEQERVGQVEVGAAGAAVGAAAAPRPTPGWRPREASRGWPGRSRRTGRRGRRRPGDRSAGVRRTRAGRRCVRAPRPPRSRRSPTRACPVPPVFCRIGTALVRRQSRLVTRA